MTGHRNNRPPQPAESDIDPALDYTGRQRRAVESQEYLSYAISDPLPTASEIVDIFGVRFFFRVNLRTCSFRYLADMIDGGIIAKRSQLLLLRGMLGKMKENACPDIMGEKHRADIDALEERITKLLDAL
jgi:hypothetical protein